MKRLDLLILAAIVACGTPATNTDLTPRASREVVAALPMWFNNPPTDSNYVFGAASATSRDLQLAVNKAQTAGRNDIAQQLETRFSSMARRFQEEVGIGDDSELLDQFTQVYRSVTDQMLIGSRVREQQVQPEGQIYRAYVLMEMPIGAVSEALLERIRGRENMYTRFRAAEAFSDLESEVENYQVWKNAMAPQQ
ncbi:MAG: LPP20 family lipoprotein [Gemmatimonadetes bacterium]|nr:LPP20 family lipoprotein [Gemmatimonadota bacterium]